MFIPTVTISLNEYESLKFIESEQKKIIEQIRNCYVVEWNDKRDSYLIVDSTEILELLKRTIKDFDVKDFLTGFVIKEKEE